MQETVNDGIMDKSPKTLDEFLNSDTFSSTVSVTVDKSIGEIFLMIIKYSISNHLSVTAMINLCKLVNSIFPKPVIPESKHFIDGLMNNKSGSHFHAVCSNCSVYIGKFEEVKDVKCCDVCKVDLDLSNPSDTSFFVVIDPSKQISDILKIHGSEYDKIIHERPMNHGYIDDVYDGNLYHDLVSSMSEVDKHNYVTGILNTDGAKKFESSSSSIWPVYLMINELPAQVRLDNLITCGLWFNKKKPNMSVSSILS